MASGVWGTKSYKATTRSIITFGNSLADIVCGSVLFSSCEGTDAAAISAGLELTGLVAGEVITAGTAEEFKDFPSLAILVF